jgi:sugar/nucleoside kinase (ribokinase family)
MVDVVARLTGPLEHGSDRPAPIELRPGGSAANTADWLESLGRSATLFARVGDDPLGRVLTGSFAGPAALGVVVDEKRPTGTCIVLVSPDGERTMVPSAGANAALSVGDLVPSAFVAGRWLHLSGYTLFGEARDTGRHALALARAAGMSISVDAASAAPIASVGAETFLGWIGVGLLLFANLDEARELSGVSDPAECARRLASRLGSAVVKLGAAGAVWSDGTVVEFAPAESTTVLDTTGAGDAFAAGMVARLTRGADPAAAMRSGHELARIACGQLGGRPSRPVG